MTNAYHQPKQGNRNTSASKPGGKTPVATKGKSASNALKMPKGC